MKKGVRTIFRRPRHAGSERRENSSDPFSGFTLLEIVLALAILAGALAVLGEVMRLSDQTAERTGDETQAQILAESVMAELQSGYLPLSAVDSARFDQVSDPPWTYSIALEPTQHNELVLVRVTVQQDLPAEKQPARFELVRWTLNPDFVSAAVEAAANAAATATSGTGTSSSSSSGSGITDVSGNLGGGSPGGR
jgi:general secretion pathway protein I